mgnify:CR=1 FL=1
MHRGKTGTAPGALRVTFAGQAIDLLTSQRGVEPVVFQEGENPATLVNVRQPLCE